MRIAIDGRTLLIPHKRGIGRHVDHILKNMVEIDPTIEIIVYGEREGLAHSILKTRLLPTKGYRLRLWENAYFPLDVWHQKCNLIHSPANTCPKYTSCPVVLTIHDLNLIKDPSRKNTEHAHYFRQRLDFSTKKSQKIITVSYSSKQDLLDIFPELPSHKIEVIYNGIDTAKFSCLSKDILKDVFPNLSSHKKYIFMIGASEKFKGTHLGWEAYCQIAKSIEHDLIITSLSSKMRTEYQQKAQKYGLENRIHLFDFVSDEQLVAFYHLAEVFLFCSEFEGFGLPLLEAMYCNCKVVATDIPTTKEITKNFAYIAQENSSYGLATKIQQAILDDVDLRQQKKHSASFCWKKAAQKTLEVYRNVIG